ncbi:MAG TPA: sigma-70 family RNA polymerase sigma factor [Thermoanaerobaculia bacterium]|nr:sigma-70 family RNA polymerase sigma factor [Thermoanaerobaculia bacterium]
MKKKRSLAPPEPPDPPDQYLGNLKLIDQIAEHAARRRYFSQEECEDFVCTVRFKLFENNYAIIAKYEVRSSFRTYLTVVINRLMLDYQNHVLGKWHPSAEAKRLGPVAVRLQMLMVREGLTLDEACTMLSQRVDMTKEELEALAAKLPPRNPPRRMEDEEKLADLQAAGESPEQGALNNERSKRQKEIRAILKAVLALLDPEDHLLIKMRSEFQVAQIAKLLGLDQKALYRRFEKIYRKLRDELEKRDILPEDVE